MRLTSGTEPPIRDWAGFPLGFAAATAATIVAVATGGTAHPLWTLSALAATAGALATLTTLRSGLATAAVCWALQSGFVLGRHGDLVFDTRSLLAGALLGAVVLTGYGLGRAARALSRSRVRTASQALAIPAQRHTSAANYFSAVPGSPRIDS